jgi:hypothetical protein
MLPILGRPIKFTDYTSAKVLAHWMPWFGTPGHTKIGYNSADQSACDAQAVAMVAMGIAGINVDYYGPDSASALACLRMLDSCERNGLAFSLCIDQGALGALTGAAAVAEYIRILKFCSEAFFSSSAYLQDAGRYVVNFFGEPAGVNWTQVRAGTAAKLALLFEESSGFTHAESDGAFGWINPTTPVSNINLPDIQAFITTANANPSKIALYPFYTGFDDSMASWGKNRFMSRRLGQTLLDTLAVLPKTAKYALLPTWNDHEEGTGVEYSQG